MEVRPKRTLTREFARFERTKMPLPDSEDIARRAQAIYDDRFRDQLESTYRGQFCAIEPDSGEYHMGSSIMEALEASAAAHPGHRAYVVRVGYPSAVRIGHLV